MESNNLCFLKYAETFSDLTNLEKIAIVRFLCSIFSAGIDPKYETEATQIYFYTILKDVLKVKPLQEVIEEALRTDKEKCFSIIRGFSSDKKSTLSIMVHEMIFESKVFNAKANVFCGICKETGVHFPYK